MSEELHRGKVKWFNRVKGYGFIQRSEGPDLFVHFSDILDSPQEFDEGDEVEFEMMEDAKGGRAVKARRVKAE